MARWMVYIFQNIFIETLQTTEHVHLLFPSKNPYFPPKGTTNMVPSGEYFLLCSDFFSVARKGLLALTYLVETFTLGS